MMYCPSCEETVATEIQWYKVKGVTYLVWVCSQCCAELDREGPEEVLRSYKAPAGVEAIGLKPSKEENK